MGSHRKPVHGSSVRSNESPVDLLWTSYESPVSSSVLLVWDWGYVDGNWCPQWINIAAFPNLGFLLNKRLSTVTRRELAWRICQLGCRYWAPAFTSSKSRVFLSCSLLRRGSHAFFDCKCSIHVHMCIYILYRHTCTYNAHDIYIYVCIDINIHHMPCRHEVKRDSCWKMETLLAKSSNINILWFDGCFPQVWPIQLS